MVVAKVTPNAPWNTPNLTATVEIDGEIYHEVPVVFIYMTPARLTIHRSQYPNGVVILNDVTPPDNMDPIELPVIYSKEDSIEVDLPHNIQWPTGTIILWE